MKGWRRETRKKLNRQSPTEIYFFKELNKWGYSPKRNKFVRGLSGKCYFLDFYFKRHKLAIELDGEEHSAESDNEREVDIRTRHGIKFLRFKNWDVWNELKSIKTVLEGFVPRRRKKKKTRKWVGIQVLKRECQKMDEMFKDTCRKWDEERTSD